MDLPRENPLVGLIREVLAGRISLEDAVAEVRTAAFVRQLCDSDLSQVDRETFSGVLGEEEGVAAFLLFEAAREATHLAQPVRRGAVLHFAGTIPPEEPGMIGLREQAYECALRLVPRETEPALWVEVATYLADCLGRLGELAAMRDLLEEALVLANALVTQDPASRAPLALTLNNIGNLYWRFRERSGAKAAYERALALYRSLARTDPDTYRQHVAITLNNLGPVFSDLGDYAAARDAFRKAAWIFSGLARNAPEMFEPQVVKALSNLGNALLRLGKLTGARSAYGKALRIARHVAGADWGIQLDIAMVQTNLGNLFSRMGEPKLARDAYQASATIYRCLADSELYTVTLNLSLCLINLGGAFTNLGDETSARAVYLEAKALSEADPLINARCLTNTAALEWKVGNRELAIGLAGQSVEVLETWLRTKGADSDYYSFKKEFDGSFHILLDSPRLQGDSQATFRMLENLRHGELLSSRKSVDAKDGRVSTNSIPTAGSVLTVDLRAAQLVDEGPEGFLHLCPAAREAVYLTVQRTVEGTIFTILDRDGFRVFRVGEQWNECATRLLQVIDDGCRHGSLAARATAEAGKGLWDKLPDEVQECFGAGASAVYLSPDDFSINLAFEFLCRSGDPDDFLGLTHVLPRTAGVLRYSQALESVRIAAGSRPKAMIFGNPAYRGAYPLPEAEKEAIAVGQVLTTRFELIPEGCPYVGKQATLDAFLEGLSGDASIIHFCGHGAYSSAEPLLCFAGSHVLAPRGLPEAHLNGRPLVMLNACVAGVTENMGGAYRGLPEAFLSRGAAAVIASAFPLSDYAGGSFGELFYERLSQGATVGESLLHARKSIARSHDSNPLHWGLYVPWGNVNASLQQCGSSTGS